MPSTADTGSNEVRNVIASLFRFVKLRCPTDGVLAEIEASAKAA
jgi:hypothetical protein